MKHTFLKIACASAAAVTFSLALAGCSGGGKKAKYDYLVTFDYNTGTLVDENHKTNKLYLGVMADSLVALQPGDTGLEAETITGYYNAGWYTPKLDDEGIPLVGEDKRVLLDRQWDFANDTVNSDLTLYANLVPLVTLTVKGGDSDLTFEGAPGMETTSSQIPSKNGYTFLGFYYDEACEDQPFSWPYTFKDTDETIYAKFLEGDWAVPDDASDLLGAISANKNVYLTHDISFTEPSDDPETPVEKISWTDKITGYNAEFNGNGHKITGVDSSWSGARNTTAQFGMFGYLGGSAYLHDVSFENVKISFTAKSGHAQGGYKVSLIASGIHEDARLENVTVTGTLKSKKSTQDVVWIQLFAISPETPTPNKYETEFGCKFDVTLEEN